MEALVLDAPNKTAIVTTIPIPTPSPTEILIRTHAIALNPVDALFVAHPLGKSGRVVGSDFAGTVQKVGASVPSSSNLTLGARVAGFLQGASSVNDRPGAFAEFLVVEWDLVWKVPEWMSLEEAATVSLCALTAAQGLFYRLGIKAPFEREDGFEPQVGEDQNVRDPLRVFIHGASTSLGQYAAQLVRITARASGREALLYGSASTARHGMLKAPPYEYDGLVDYKQPNWVETFFEMVGGVGVQFGIECISEGDSVRNVSKTLVAGGNMAVFRSREGRAWSAKPGELPCEPIYGVVWEGLGVELQYRDLTFPAPARARGFLVAFYKFLSRMAGKEDPLTLQPNTVRLMPGGLEKVATDGFALLGPGVMTERQTSPHEEHMRPVSAEKLVYKLISK